MLYSIFTVLGQATALLIFGAVIWIASRLIEHHKETRVINQTKLKGLLMPETQEYLCDLGDQLHEIAELLYEPNWPASALKDMQELLFSQAHTFAAYVKAQEAFNFCEMHEKIDKEFEEP